MNRHLVPALGKHRLDRLEPEHLERLYRKMIDGGARPGTAHQVHRTIRTAPGETHRRGHVTRNVAALAKPPRVQVEPIRPYALDEVQRVLAAAMERPNGARWAIALALGLRQGGPWVFDGRTLIFTVGRGASEALGRVRWTATAVAARAVGSRGFASSGVGWIRTSGMRNHRRGRRVVGLPAELVELLRDHRSVQDVQRKTARQLWVEGGWVFTSATGRPLSLNSDYRECKALLRAAGVSDGRLTMRGIRRRRCSWSWARADGDECDGLVQYVDGGEVSARDRPD